MKKSFAALSVAVLAVSLTACSSSTEPEAAATPAAETTIPTHTPTPGKGNIASDGTDFTTIKEGDLKLTTDSDYGFMSDGAIGTVEFVDKADKRVKDFEALRKDTHGSAVEYAVVELDNRDGVDKFSVRGVNVYDPDGLKYEFTQMDEVIETWEPISDYSSDKYSLIDGTEIKDSEYTKLYNRGVDLRNAQDNIVDVSEKTTIVLGVFTAEGIFPIDVESAVALGNGWGNEYSLHNPLIGEYREWMAAQEAGVEWEAYDASTAEPVPSE